MHTLLSLPLRECGLKFINASVAACQSYVTPLAGVWIEIPHSMSYPAMVPVTPLAGVWIKI